jgi:hypothetical protein
VELRFLLISDAPVVPPTVNYLEARFLISRAAVAGGLRQCCAVRLVAGGHRISLCRRDPLTHHWAAPKNSDALLPTRRLWGKMYRRWTASRISVTLPPACTGENSAHQAARLRSHDLAASGHPG